MTATAALNGSMRWCPRIVGPATPLRRADGDRRVGCGLQERWDESACRPVQERGRGRGPRSRPASAWLPDTGDPRPGLDSVNRWRFAESSSITCSSSWQTWTRTGHSIQPPSPHSAMRNSTFRTTVSHTGSRNWTISRSAVGSP